MASIGSQTEFKVLHCMHSLHEDSLNSWEMKDQNAELLSSFFLIDIPYLISSTALETDAGIHSQTQMCL